MSTLWAQIGAVLALLAGGLVWLLTWGARRERRGRDTERAQSHERDRGNARRIEDAADAARRAPGGDPVERVRRHERLRDD